MKWIFNNFHWNSFEHASSHLCDSLRFLYKLKGICTQDATMSYWFGKVKKRNQQEKQYKHPHKVRAKVNNINYKSAQGTSNTSEKNKEKETMKWNVSPLPQHRLRAATSAASTAASALAACCVNSFLISAYHFISTFQRKAQCERCHVHVQEEDRVQRRFRVSSGRAKVQSHCCAEREAKWNEEKRVPIAIAWQPIYENAES